MQPSLVQIKESIDLVEDLPTNLLQILLIKGHLLEVHILDFNEDVYGQLIEVMFRKKIRNELKFDGVDALKTQIGIDVEDVRKYFNED